MDDMTRLRRFRSEVPRPDRIDLQAEENRLLGAMIASAPARPERAHARARRLRFGLAAGLAATAVATGLVVVGVGKPRSPSVARTMPVAAVEALNRAAEKVSTQPELHPKPGQYLVYESQRMSPVESNESAHHQSRYLSRRRDTVWYPVEGDATGGVFEGAVLPPKAYPGWPIPPDAWETVGHTGPEKFVDEDRTPDYRRTDYAHTSHLPTTSTGMYQYLYLYEGAGPSADVHAWDNVGGLLGAYLPPAQRAALFRAASAIHGVTMTGRVTDAAGRTGIGVALVDDGLGIRDEFILDPATYQYLGERSVVTNSARAKAPVGSVLASSALLKISVADHAPAIKRN